MVYPYHIHIQSRGLIKLRKVFICVRVLHRDKRKNRWNTKLKHEEQLIKNTNDDKKSNVTMRETDDNVDHNKVVII